MTRGLLISRTEKIRLCKLSLKSPTYLNIAHYKNYRNLYNSLIRAAKNCTTVHSSVTFNLT